VALAGGTIPGFRNLISSKRRTGGRRIDTPGKKFSQGRRVAITRDDSVDCFPMSIRPSLERRMEEPSVPRVLRNRINRRINHLPHPSRGPAMNSIATLSTPGKGQRFAGRALSGLACLFLLLDGVMKLVKPQVVVDTTLQLGYPESTITGMGVALILSTTAYLLPRTSLLGAVLLTAYLGGAVASHVRIGSPLLSHVLFPVYIALMVWGGLVLRDARLRLALMPWRHPVG